MNTIVGLGLAGTLLYLLYAIIEKVLYNSKTVLITNSNKKIVAILVASIYVIFNTIIVKLVATTDIYISIVIQLVSNAIGIYVAMSIKEKNIKEYIWRYDISINPDFKITDEFENTLIENNIEYSYYQASYRKKLYDKFVIYTWNKRGSKKINQLLLQYPKVKKTIIKTGSYNK